MWRFLFSPHGRVSRKAIWLGLVLPQLGVIFVTTLIDMGLGWYDDDADIGVLGGLASVFYIWPNIAVTIKRFHDRDMTGWWVLYFIIMIIAACAFALVMAMLFSDAMSKVALFSFFLPVIAVVIAQVVIVYFLPGTQGENRYGPDPREA